MYHVDMPKKMEMEQPRTDNVWLKKLYIHCACTHAHLLATITPSVSLLLLKTAAVKVMLSLYIQTNSLWLII